MVLFSPSSRWKIRNLTWYLILVQVTALCLLTFFNLRHLNGSPATSSNNDFPVTASSSSSSCNRPTKGQQAAENFIVPKDSFGACLIIMDDNHFLPEWLAYHYHRLPLRRLIVAIDPRSQTSPREILNRYDGLMKITVWNEEDYMPPNLLAKHLDLKESQVEELEELYLERQMQFYARCMAILKKEKLTWTAITDTDEYILPNRNAQGEYNRVKNISSKKTIFEMLQETRKSNKMIKLGCVSMHRVQFGLKESPRALVQNITPPGYNGSDFVTLRWRYHDMDNKPLNGKLSKCMVNLTRAYYSDFIVEEVNTHRPIKKLCREENMRIENEVSPFVVYHYAGSWEQWNYRNDFRTKRQKEEFEKFMALDKYVDDTIRPWLADFVETHGQELAQYLLRGAGALTPKRLEGSTRRI